MRFIITQATNCDENDSLEIFQSLNAWLFKNLHSHEKMIISVVKYSKICENLYSNKKFLN